MARNQKRETVELRWQRLLLVLGLVAGIAVLTVGYVLQRRAHDELGIQIKAVEREIGWVTGRIHETRTLLERSRRKENLMFRAQQMGIELVEITASQRVVIPLIEGSDPATLDVVPARPIRSTPSPSRTGPVGPLATAGRLATPR